MPFLLRSLCSQVSKGVADATQEEADYSKYVKAHDMTYDNIDADFAEQKSELNRALEEQSSEFAQKMAAVATEITGENVSQRRTAKLHLLNKQHGEAEGRMAARLCELEKRRVGIRAQKKQWFKVSGA